MPQEAIFYPVLTLVAHTFVVWVWMYVDRLRVILKHKVSISAFRDRQTAAKAPGEISTSSDNLKNLFELPVLLYTASIVLYLTRGVTPLILGLCRVFVFGRVVHSLIHITYNKVMHRFYVYIASSILLWVLWIAIAMRLTA